MDSTETLVRCTFRQTIDNDEHDWIYCLLTNLKSLGLEKPNERNSAILYNESEWVWLFHVPSDSFMEFKLCRCHPKDFQIEKEESLQSPHQFNVPKVSADQAISIELHWESKFTHELISVDDILMENEASFERLPTNNDNFEEPGVNIPTDEIDSFLDSKNVKPNTEKISPKVKFKIMTESLDSICGSSSEIEEIMSQQNNRLLARSKNSSSEIPSLSPEKKSSENVSKVDEVPEDEVFSLMETEDGLVDIDRYLLENSQIMENRNIERIKTTSSISEPLKPRTNVIIAKIHALLGLSKARTNDQNAFRSMVSLNAGKEDHDQKLSESNTEIDNDNQRINDLDWELRPKEQSNIINTNKDNQSNSSSTEDKLSNVNMTKIMNISVQNESAEVEDIILDPKTGEDNITLNDSIIDKDTCVNLEDKEPNMSQDTSSEQNEESLSSCNNLDTIQVQSKDLEPFNIMDYSIANIQSSTDEPLEKENPIPLDKSVSFCMPILEDCVQQVEDNNLPTSYQSNETGNTQDNLFENENIKIKFQLEENIENMNNFDPFECNEIILGDREEHHNDQNESDKEDECLANHLNGSIPIITEEYSKEIITNTDLQPKINDGNEKNSENNNYKLLEVGSTVYDTDLLHNDFGEISEINCESQMDSDYSPAKCNSNRRPVIYVGNKHLNRDYEILKLIDSDFSCSTSSTEDIFLSHKIAGKQNLCTTNQALILLKTDRCDLNNKRNYMETTIKKKPNVFGENCHFLDAESNDSSMVTSLSKESVDELISTDNLYENFTYIPALGSSNNVYPNQVVSISIVDTSLQTPLVQVANEIGNTKLDDTSHSEISPIGCVEVVENTDHIDCFTNHSCIKIASSDSQSHNDEKFDENVCSINDNDKRKDIYLSSNVDVINSTTTNGNDYFNTEIFDYLDEQQFPLTDTNDKLFHENTLENLSMLNPMLCFLLNKDTNQSKHQEPPNEDLFSMKQRRFQSNKLSVETSISSNQDSAIICDSDLTSDTQSAVGTIVQDDSFEEFIFNHPMPTSQTIDSLFISAISSNKRTISEEYEPPLLSINDSQEIIFDDTNLPLPGKFSQSKPKRPTEYCSLPIPPRSGMKRSPALEGVCDLLKKTDAELKLIQQQTFILVNDDDLFPDSITPTKADSSLRSEGGFYDFPYIDDEIFCPDLSLDLKNFKYPIKRAKLANCDECTLASTLDLSMESLSTKLSKQPIVPKPTKKKRSRFKFFRFCKCGCFS